MENTEMNKAVVNEMTELDPVERAEIRNRYSETYFPNPVKEPVWYGRREHTRIVEKNAIIDQNVRPDQEKPTVFGICSDHYKIVFYEDIVKMVEGVVGTIKDFGEIKINPYSYADGGRLRINLSFPEKKINIVKGDNIIPKIEIFSSYDLSTMLKGRFGAFQLKCTNGMGVWKTFKKFAKRHLQNLHLMELESSIIEGLDVFALQATMWKEWTTLKIPQKVYEEIWTDLPFSPAEKERIEALPEIGTKLLLPDALKSNDLNVWSFNSVLTQFATHEVKSELRRIELEPVIARSMEKLYDRLH
jgi:hypothetical protein